MVGRPVDTTYTRPARPRPGGVALEVKNLSGPSGFSDINLTVRAGEIVGLSGWSAPAAPRSRARSSAPTA